MYTHLLSLFLDCKVWLCLVWIVPWQASDSIFHFIFLQRVSALKCSFEVHTIAGHLLVSQIHVVAPYTYPPLSLSVESQSSHLGAQRASLSLLLHLGLTEVCFTTGAKVSLRYYSPSFWEYVLATNFNVSLQLPFCITFDLEDPLSPHFLSSRW